MLRQKGVSPQSVVNHALGVTSRQSDTLERLKEIDKKGLIMINLVLQSAFIEKKESDNYSPLSLLFIGKPSGGKSRLLLSLRKYPFVTYADDITPKLLIEFLKQVEKGEKR